MIDFFILKTLKGDPHSCGFGMNVMPDGVYTRKNYANPFLTKKETVTATNLMGEWTSTEDPKSGVKIANGQFLFTYESQNPEPALRYIYFPTCPKDCTPSVKMPCLKVIGQDEVCYSIVKADGKVLELSQIGGTGNTNRYVRKK